MLPHVLCVRGSRSLLQMFVCMHAHTRYPRINLCCPNFPAWALRSSSKIIRSRAALRRREAHVLTRPGVSHWIRVRDFLCLERLRLHASCLLNNVIADTHILHTCTRHKMLCDAAITCPISKFAAPAPSQMEERETRSIHANNHDFWPGLANIRTLAL